MNAQQKAAFVAQFLKEMGAHIEAHLPVFPEDWDGHELREWIAEEFYRERTTLMRNDRARMRRYKREAAQLPRMRAKP